MIFLALPFLSLCVGKPLRFGGGVSPFLIVFDGVSYLAPEAHAKAMLLQLMIDAIDKNLVWVLVFCAFGSFWCGSDLKKYFCFLCRIWWLLVLAG